MVDKKLLKRTRYLRTFIAVCHTLPAGRNGLEGFTLCGKYTVEEMEDGAGKYYRVYLLEDYYETCGPIVFRRYFSEELRI